MKKDIFKIIIPGVLFALLSASCHKDELLSPVPSNSLADVSAFDNAARVSSQVGGLYAALKAGNLLGGRYFIYNDVRADNFINQTNNAVTALQTWNYSLTSTNQEVIGLWAAAYSAINQCNVFLDGMKTKGNAVVGATLAANYNAEAKLVRAICYYDMLQLYARPYWDGSGAKPGLPLRLTAIKGSGYSDLARTTVDSIYKQIISDLDSAEAGLPLTYTSATLNITRAHRNTAIALKTRVYLSMQNYAKVITEANKIVTATAPFTATTGVAHALQSDITKVFVSPNTTTESILSMPFVTGSDVPGTQNSVGSYYLPSSGYTNAGAGEYSLNASGVVADPGWTATDKRRSFIFTTTDGKQWLIKYPLGTKTSYVDWTPVIRYSEVLLSLAEARARSTNTVDAQAVALLNAVRNRSDAATTYTTASFANPTALFNAILQERNIEFLGEGLRSPDLMRLGLTIPGKSVVNAVAPTDNSYIWPISSNELLYNHLMSPN